MNKKQHCVCQTVTGNCTALAYTDKDGKIKGMRKCKYPPGLEQSCPYCYSMYPDED